MKNRIISFLMLMIMVFSVMTPALSFAQEEKYSGRGNHYVTETGEYQFNLSFEGIDVTPSDILEINLPIRTDVTENDFFTHEWKENGKNNFILKLTPKDNFSKVEGHLKGSGKFSLGEKIIPIKIGNAIVDGGTEVTESNETPGERQSFYKAGRISEDGKQIQWDINIKQGVANRVWLSDELGVGQKLVKDSVKINIVNGGNTTTLKPEHKELGALDEANSYVYNDEIVAYGGTKVSDEEFHLMVDTSKLKDNEYLQIVYLAEITDPKQSLFANSYQLESTRKNLSIVEIEFDSSFNGEKPKPSIPILPQVGEKFFSVRGLLILCLLLLGVYGLRGRE